MKGENLPISHKVFNSLSQDERTSLFWCNVYASSQEDEIHYKDDGAWVIYEVNEYYIFLFFKSKGDKSKDGIFSGELVEIYASKDLLEFIHKERRDIWENWINTSFYVPIDYKLPKENYYSNYLFVDLDYEIVIDRVSSFFYDDYRMYEIDNDLHTVRARLSEKWDSSKINNKAMLYYSADDYNTVGSGISLLVANTNLRIGYNNLPKPIPSIIFDKCKNVPHIIEIEFSRSRGYASAGYEIMERLAQKFEGSSFMLSSDFQVMAIKANNYLNEEEKVEHLLGYLSNNLSDESLQVTALEVSTLLGDNWDILTKESKRFITTGFFHYHYVIRNQNTVFDTSNPSLSFSKVIETELVDKVINPFKSFFENNYTSSDLDYDFKDNNLKRMARFLAGKTNKPPELGSFAYFLKNVINSKKRANESGSIKAFKSFCQTMIDPDFFLDEEILCNMLIRISTKYRNGSAHIEVLPVSYLIEFYKILFTDRFLINFLQSSKKSTP